MYRSKRFQSRVSTGRMTLPAAILISVACWVLTGVLSPDRGTESGKYLLWQTVRDGYIPTWADSLFSFVLYGVIGYLLIALNNTFAIIRMRASVQTVIYFLLIAVCPWLHTLYAGDLATVLFLMALFFLFRSYQQSRSSGDLFHAFVFLGAGSLIFPQLMFFMPLFWVGAFNFQSLRPKSFFASLTGWSLPYWFLLGHAYYHEQMELFYAPFRELTTFTPFGTTVPLHELATIGYLLVLFVVSAAHCLISGYEDKIRTRSYLHFLIFLTFCMFVYLGLQPSLSAHLLPLLLTGVSFLTGHLFVLTDSRGTNLFFIGALLLLVLLFGFNVWILL